MGREVGATVNLVLRTNTVDDRNIDTEKVFFTVKNSLVDMVKKLKFF